MMMTSNEEYDAEQRCVWRVCVVYVVYVCVCVCLFVMYTHIFMIFFSFDEQKKKKKKLVKHTKHSLKHIHTHRYTHSQICCRA